MANYEADLEPETRCPRVRLALANGWTVSMILFQGGPCEFTLASLAAYPSMARGQGLAEAGPQEATPDEALEWIDEIRKRRSAAIEGVN